MLQMPIEDFIEEVKCELVSYDEISDEQVIAWETKFLEKAGQKGLKSIKLKSIGDTLDIIVDDESDVFQVADGFYSAVINNEESEYWQSL